MNICQKCHTINPDVLTQCQRCGGVLMPPMVPEHLKAEVSFMLDDEALGRISSLEVNLRSSEKNYQSLVEYLEKQSLNNLHLLLTVEKLVKRLDEAGLVNRRQLERLVNRDLQGQLFGFEQRQYLEALAPNLLASFRGQREERFIRLIRRAIPLFYTPQHSQGLTLLRQALRLDPANAQLLRILSEIYFIVGDYVKARRCLARLLAVSPGSPPAHLLTALIHLKSNRFPPALENLEAARTTVPESFSIPFLSGVVHFLQADYPAAGEHFKQANGFRPLPQVSMLSAMSFYLGRRAEIAGLDWREQPGPGKTGFGYFLAGLIERSRAEKAAAEQHFEQAIRLNAKWKEMIGRVLDEDSRKAEAACSRLFVSRLHREMEKLMGVLMSEIQKYQP